MMIKVVTGNITTWGREGQIWSCAWDPSPCGESQICGVVVGQAILRGCMGLNISLVVTSNLYETTFLASSFYLLKLLHMDSSRTNFRPLSSMPVVSLFSNMFFIFSLWAQQAKAKIGHRSMVFCQLCWYLNNMHLCCLLKNDMNAKRSNQRKSAL